MKKRKYAQCSKEDYNLPKAWLHIHYPDVLSSEAPICTTSQTGFSSQTEVVTPSQPMSIIFNQSMPNCVGLLNLELWHHLNLCQHYVTSQYEVEWPSSQVKTDSLNAHHYILGIKYSCTSDSGSIELFTTLKAFKDRNV